MQINETAWNLLMQKLNAMDKKMDAVALNVEKQNGRVRKLEKWRTATMATVATLFIMKGPEAFKMIVEALK